MKILKTINDLKVAIKKISNLGFVPTMGSLHNGHISLIKNSKKKCNSTLVSIYINPTQFNKLSDFRSYPRKIDHDIKVLKKNKVDFVFIPKTKDIYKKKRIKKIIIPKKNLILCAKFRKGHFEGVLDVVERFIDLIKPKYIFLGEKDFQQLFLIKNHLSKKNVRVISCKTIRNKNFIALSSRNSLLSKLELKKSSLISKKLFNLKRKIIKNHKLIQKIIIIKKEFKEKLNIKIDYLEARSLKDLKIYKKGKKFKIFIAYYLNKVRLIDNF